jgi:predicted RNase H-like HicB family nuclease
MSEKDLKIPKVLSCLLSQDADTKFWLGQCLDFALVTSGKTPDNAWENLRAVITTHVEHCFTHHPDGLKKRAVDEDWQLFEALKKEQLIRRTEKITLRLAPPQAEQIPPFWIEGVESAFLGDVREQASPAAVSAVN